MCHWRWQWSAISCHFSCEQLLGSLGGAEQVYYGTGSFEEGEEMWALGVFAGLCSYLYFPPCYCSALITWKWGAAAFFMQVECPVPKCRGKTFPNTDVWVREMNGFCWIHSCFRRGAWIEVAAISTAGNVRRGWAGFSSPVCKSRAFCHSPWDSRVWLHTQKSVCVCWGLVDPLADAVQGAQRRPETCSGLEKMVHA